jgi:hypothetical protein
MIRYCFILIITLLFTAVAAAQISVSVKDAYELYKDGKYEENTKLF